MAAGNAEVKRFNQPLVRALPPLPQTNVPPSEFLFQSSKLPALVKKMLLIVTERPKRTKRYVRTITRFLLIKEDVLKEGTLKLETIFS